MKCACVTIMGGLGNQLYQLAYADYLRRTHGYRCCIINEYGIKQAGIAGQDRTGQDRTGQNGYSSPTSLSSSDSHIYLQTQESSGLYIERYSHG